MLALKVAMVPLFITLVTLAGRRWGAGVAGLLAGFPVVAGPIVIFIALEQGAAFGALTATAAILAVVALLVFGIVYSWISLTRSWITALSASVIAWLLAALALAQLPVHPIGAMMAAIVALLLTPWLLPKRSVVFIARSSLRDLPYRMITGGLLTLTVTGLAATLGEIWSGLLAVFPVISLVLAVFTHRGEGAAQVVYIYRGMVRGLYSFCVFFFVLSVCWTRIDFWSSCALAIGAGVLAQAIVQMLVRLRR